MSQGLPILLVDDHRVVADALAMALSRVGFPYVEVADLQLQSVAEIVATADSLAPAVVVLDLRVTSGHTVLALVEPVTQVGCRVIVMSPLDEPELFGECLFRGAQVILDRRASLEEAVDVLHRVMAGETDVMPVNGERAALVQSALDARRHVNGHDTLWESLTAHERDVLRELARGRRVGEIAALHATAETTVRSQVRSILTKLDVRSQTAAVVLALRAGWVT